MKIFQLAASKIYVLVQDRNLNQVMDVHSNDQKRWKILQNHTTWRVGLLGEEIVAGEWNSSGAGEVEDCLRTCRAMDQESFRWDSHCCSSLLLVPKRYDTEL